MTREGDRQMDRTASQAAEGKGVGPASYNLRVQLPPLSTPRQHGYDDRPVPPPPPPGGRRLDGLSQADRRVRAQRAEACALCHFPFWAFAWVLQARPPGLLRSAPSLPGAGEHEGPHPTVPAGPSRAAIPLAIPWFGSWPGRMSLSDTAWDTGPGPGVPQTGLPPAPSTGEAGAAVQTGPSRPRASCFPSLPSLYCEGLLCMPADPQLTSPSCSIAPAPQHSTHHPSFALDILMGWQGA